MPPFQQASPGALFAIVAWYWMLGVLHEGFHLLAASCLLADTAADRHVPTPKADKNLLFDLIIGRSISFDESIFQNEGYQASLSVIRHAGWIGSSLVAALTLLLTSSNRRRRRQKEANTGTVPSFPFHRFTEIAILVALEAISTDLLGWSGLRLPLSDAQSGTICFFCGNFGIIVLHHLWWTNSDQRRQGLDVLESMIRVTMMRGAQCGGVVCYPPASSSSPKNNKAIVTKVVNRKRTDLSKTLRTQVQKDVFGGMLKSSQFTEKNTQAMALSGHTRFATSSKATLDGCHPQIWSPASVRRVYNDKTGTFTDVTVENYITHNGDFDYYTLNGKTYDLSEIQKWLVGVTHVPLQSTVDSLAVAGVIDLLRTKGSFGLSCRYAISMGMSTSVIEESIQSFPLYAHFDSLGRVFENVLQEMLKTTTLDKIEESDTVRSSFALRVVSKLEARATELVKPLERYLSDNEGPASLQAFCLATIDAFFDNDLFWTTKTFLGSAKGSFGLCITSSMDAQKQICLAARGQTMSVAFYPNKGLICYGSEQAAVKAGMNATFSTEGKTRDALGISQGDVDDDALRLDLDDSGGEIALLDWNDAGANPHIVSRPHRQHSIHELMNGKLRLVLYQESKASSQDSQLYHRMTRLSRNRFVKPLRPESTKDQILSDIQDIPKICADIQDEFHASKAASSLNRLTAYNLQRCLRERLEMHLEKNAPVLGIDILLTGCEVSLWLAEQFATDLQKAFPRLRIKALSSNKLLGLFGQEIPLPALGHPYSARTYSLHDSIVIIVSHSGGTFAPLCCSNLLQSATKNIFVVTSEWDTQIGKQLRAMDRENDEDHHSLFNSRVFSTEVGLRSAEPCSVTVAATHQLLTNLFQYLSAVIISDERYKRVTEAVITENDLQVLQRLNTMNIEALSEIVGCNAMGHVFDVETDTVRRLKANGKLWADHILENVRAYIMTAIYIFVTVVSGYPIAYACFYAAGMDSSSNWVYLIRTLDAAIYFWLPQINILLIRLWQRRNLLHRMVGRTVVIGDLPWVAQSAEAFLSKIFAVSYSIAGLNVHSGNPADHLVHKYTHRVVRGTLLIVGRPDGRLSALSTAEAACCLSVNQASSIQSWGGTCESVTIGHNPFKLDLSAQAIFLKRKRPMFLCERILVENDAKNESKDASLTEAPGPKPKPPLLRQISSALSGSKGGNTALDRSLNRSLHLLDSSVRPKMHKRRSAAALLGAYVGLEGQQRTDENKANDEIVTVDEILVDAIQAKTRSDKARKLFHVLAEGDSVLSEEKFVSNCSKVSKDLSEEEARRVFFSADEDRSGALDYDEFVRLLSSSDIEGKLKAPTLSRNSKGIIQIEASTEKYFGEELRRLNAGKDAKDTLDFRLAKMQHLSQELYETRIASLQRFVGMVVMFHHIGDCVRKFFAKISFGFWDYRMDRTHSIMRIATTASPVSGSDVRQQMRRLRLLKKVNHSVNVISGAYKRYRLRKKASEATSEGQTTTER